MATVIKPVILDETGQSMVTLLGDIKTAIENQSTSLNNLSDVDVTHASNGQTINYDSTLGKWVNGNIGLGDMLTADYDDDGDVATAGGIVDYVAAQIGNIDNIQKVSLPTAEASNIGKIYQYIGATNANYTNGYFYKCIENSGAYSWQVVKVQDNGAFTVSDETLIYNGN